MRFLLFHSKSNIADAGFINGPSHLARSSKSRSKNEPAHLLRRDGSNQYSDDDVVSDDSQSS